MTAERTAAATFLVAIALSFPSAALAQEAAPEKSAASDKSVLPVVVSGFVHAEWTVFRQTSQEEVNSDGTSLNEDRFVLRRARLRARADHGYTHGVVEIEANTVRELQVRPVNVEASFKYPESRPALDPEVDQRALPLENWFMVTAGLFRSPFGFEANEGTLRRPFLEQSTMSAAFFPGQFDLGVRVTGGFSVVNYSLGIMNGSPIGQRTFAGLDPNKSKDLLLRVGAAGDVTDKIRIEGGVSALTGRGFHAGRPATSDRLVWRDLNEDTVVDPIELQSISGSAAEPSATFKRFAVGADLRVFVKFPVLGELQVRGEIIRASNLDRGLIVADPVASAHDLRELGYYIGVSQEVTRFAQVGFRYDRYNPDADASEREPFALVPRDLTYSTASFMVAARMPFARLVAQYDLRRNALGRDVAGAPTTLADDSFTLRAEVRF